MLARAPESPGPRNHPSASGRSRRRRSWGLVHGREVRILPARPVAFRHGMDAGEERSPRSMGTQRRLRAQPRKGERDAASPRRDPMPSSAGRRGSITCSLRTCACTATSWRSTAAATPAPPRVRTRCERYAALRVSIRSTTVTRRGIGRAPERSPLCVGRRFYGAGRRARRTGAIPRTSIWWTSCRLPAGAPRQRRRTRVWLVERGASGGRAHHSHAPALRLDLRATHCGPALRGGSAG
jgi:hypothetical protein